MVSGGSGQSGQGPVEVDVRRVREAGRGLRQGPVEGCGWRQRQVLEHSAASVSCGLGRTVEAALWAAGFYALRKLSTGWVCPDVDEVHTHTRTLSGTWLINKTDS